MEQQPQEMEVEQDDSKFQAITLSLCWLSNRDLRSVALLNQEYLAAAREDHLWQPSLSKLEEMPLHHSKIQYYDDMYIPFRIHGETRDDYSFFPHPRDRGARRSPEPPVLSAAPVWEVQTKVEGGKIYDCFHRARDSVYTKGRLIAHREPIWLPREYPMQCNACQGVTLNNETEVFRHCSSYEHISRMQPEHERIPPEFVDPRYDADYANLSSFHKVKVMSEFRARVVRALRAPMDEAGIEYMRSVVEELRVSVSTVYFELETMSHERYQEVRANCSLDRVMSVAVEKFVVKDFLKDGVACYGNGLVSILRHGYSQFGRVLLGERRGRFANEVSGSDYFA